MKECDFFWHEGNSICEDDINVYVKYEILTNDASSAVQNNHVNPQLPPDNYIITKRSFDGNVSMITQASSSFFSELVV